MASLQQVEQIFHGALGVEGDEARAAFLRQRCGGDDSLLVEVSSLLRAWGEQAASGGQAPAENAPEEEHVAAAERYGPYQVDRLIGRGGMGAVYLAHRADGQFEQTVAIKVIAPHLADEEFVRRFRIERQALATLTHPNITRLLDGGVSPAGDPYLVMEYVEGEPLDRYCDRARLSIEARLHLFRAVCEAVDFAHRNLILHRDLKPGNILVTADGTVKLLDFGTALLISDSTAVTRTQARMVTPRYASPEQLRGERGSIAGDVFSLGVVLYELLTGAWPFGDAPSALAELRRALGVSSATRPGTAPTEQAAENRSIPLPKLRRLLQGDLSAIVLKALESDEAQRCATVRQLVDDIGRYLHGRPVEARAQTLVYRGRKFLRRHWIPVGLAAAFVCGLAGAAAVAVHQARVARDETLKSEQVRQFLTGMLSSAGDARFDAHKYTVSEMLDSAEQRLAKGQRQDPLVQALLHLNLAMSYDAMNALDKALLHLDAALPSLRRLGEERYLAEALEVKAHVVSTQGHLEDAAKYSEEALSRLQRLGAQAPPALVFGAKYRLAEVLSFMMRRETERARRLYQEAIALGQSEPSIPRKDVAMAMIHYAGLVLEEGKPREAEAMLLRALDTGRKEDPDGFWQANALFGLTAIRGRLGDQAGAKEFARQMIEVNRNTLGPDSAEVAQAKMAWALPASQTGEIEGAVQKIAEAMPVIERNFPSPSLNLWHGAQNASRVLRRAGRLAEAERYARQALAVATAAHLSANDTRVGSSWEVLGEALFDEQKEAEGREALTRAAAIYRQAGGTWTASAERLEQRLAAIPTTLRR